MEISKKVTSLLHGNAPELLSWLKAARSNDILKETPSQQLPSLRLEIHTNAPRVDYTPPGDHVMQVGRGVGGFMSSATKTLGHSKGAHVKQGKENRRSVLLYLPLSAQEIHSVLNLAGIKSVSETDREMRHGRVRTYPTSDERGL